MDLGPQRQRLFFGILHQQKRAAGVDQNRGQPFAQREGLDVLDLAFLVKIRNADGVGFLIVQGHHETVIPDHALHLRLQGGIKDIYVIGRQSRLVE